MRKMIDGRMKPDDYLDIDADKLVAKMELRNLFPEVYKNG